MRFDSFEHLLSHFASVSPDAPALRYEKQTLSFAELYERVLRRAEELRSGGKSCLGLLCDGSLDNVIEIFAGNLARLQLVLLDDSLDKEILGTLTRYTDVDTLWGDEELVEELEPSLTEGVKDGKGKILFFTSGTTDRSKAVVLTDHSLCQSAWNGSQKLPLAPEDTLLCMLPLCHVFGFVCGLMWGLSCGCCVALGRGALLAGVLPHLPVDAPPDEGAGDALVLRHGLGDLVALVQQVLALRVGGDHRLEFRDFGGEVGIGP